MVTPTPRNARCRCGTSHNNAVESKTINLAVLTRRTFSPWRLLHKAAEVGSPQNRGTSHAGRAPDRAVIPSGARYFAPMHRGVPREIDAPVD